MNPPTLSQDHQPPEKGCPSILGNLWEGRGSFYMCSRTNEVGHQKSAISFFSLTLAPSSEHHPSYQGFFFPFLQSIFFPLVGICLQLHLGHRSLSVCGEWKGSRLQGFLLERSKQLNLLLVSFSFRGTVSQGSCETALVAFTYITLCLEFTAISLLLNLPALAPSMLKVHFVSGFYLLPMGF